jgi:hypothetical protein
MLGHIGYLYNAYSGMYIEEMFFPAGGKSGNQELGRPCVVCCVSGGETVGEGN